MSVHDKRYRRIIKDIIHLREEAGVNQQILAEILSLAQPDISKIERCQRRLDVLEFFELVQAISEKNEAKPIDLIEQIYETFCQH